LAKNRWGSARSHRALCYSVSCGGQRRHGGFNSKQKLGFPHQPAHTPPAPAYEKKPKHLKENARRALQHAVEHRPRVDAERRGQRRSMAALSRLSLLLWAHLASRDDEMVGNVERRGAPPRGGVFMKSMKLRDQAGAGQRLPK
jgi:hypothetical protein